ncbi:MAG TPA: CocE/NonD family hydrolase [Actinomycetota bacterium]|nr:CocE/NonD family hydrolase [Actinomycetota bacterium]
MRSEEAWITMADGVHLAATLYLPDHGEGPWPAVLEYLPYRKDDWTLPRDLALYPYLVDRGYAGARVDIRGTGRSEGRLPDGEYSERELEDGEAVIAWLASRPWSNGAVGMWGISWGGFNAIQMAMRRPPALRAIVAVDASDDLFRLDIHYIDGIWHLDEYEVGIDLWNGLTRAPDFPTDETSLAERFDAEPWLVSWLRHQRDGPFWRRGSLSPDYDRVRVPALLVGGLLDGYRDSVPRMLEHVSAPTRAIVGPWNHSFPHDAVPGPAIEWRHEVVRWFDRWLKGIEVPDGPRLAVYLRSWHPPDPELGMVPGSWRGGDWPTEGAEERVLHLGSGGTLNDRPGDSGADRLPYVPSAGAEAGAWWGELPIDQAPLDATCLVYETEPIPEDVAIIGSPRAMLRASVDAPLAHFIARLSDVAPDGRVTLTTGGALNGAHRRSTDRPEPLAPDVPEDLVVPMRFTSWVFPAGHRIRLAVSNHLWPMLWPTPHRMTMLLDVEGSSLVLPVVPLDPSSVPRFEAPARAAVPSELRRREKIQPTPWIVERTAGRAAASWRGEEEARYRWGELRSSATLRFEVEDERPDLARAFGDGEVLITLSRRTLRWRTGLSLHADAEAFHYRYRRTLDENGREIRRRDWAGSVLRDFQ